MITKMGTFGDNLRTAMSRAGVAVDREQLATRLAVSVGQVDKWMASGANPRLNSLLKIAKALNVSIESLCSGVDPEYDAMRSLDDAPASLVELWQSVAPGPRQSMLGILRSLAGRSGPDDEGTPVPPSLPPDASGHPPAAP